MGKITPRRLAQLMERQGYKCALTGEELTPKTSGLDHIVPVKLGGENTIENVQFVTRDVNKMKNTLSQSEFVSICRKVVEWQDRQSGLNR